MCSIFVGWYQYYWVYGASSLAINTSRWQVLLVSMIPKTLTGKKMQRHLSFFFFSLTTDMNHVFQNSVVPALPQNPNKNDPGVRVDYFLFPAVCQLPFVSREWLF